MCGQAVSADGKSSSKLFITMHVLEPSLGDLAQLLEWRDHGIVTVDDNFTSALNRLDEQDDEDEDKVMKAALTNKHCSH